jgi:hypothetical protein
MTKRGFELAVMERNWGDKETWVVNKFLREAARRFRHSLKEAGTLRPAKKQ